MSNSDFEREANIHETVVPPRRIGGGMSIILVMGGVAAVLALWYFSVKPSTKEAAKKQEEFRTTRQDTDFGFNTPAGKGDNHLILAPPPPPAPPPPAPAPIQPPAPAPAPVVVRTDDTDARAAAAEAADQDARLKSQMFAFGGGGGAASAEPIGGPLGGANTHSAGSGVADYKEEDANRRFATAMSSQAVETVQATHINRIDALIPAGTIMRGVLETAIQSDLPGMVRAKMSQDIYSFDGRRVLLPKDTMLIGTYRSGIARGQTRVLIIWTRALRADGTSVSLGSYGADDLGRSALTGIVDNHYLERFGSAAVLSIVGGVSSFIAGLNIHGQSTTGSSYQSPSYQAESQAQQTISQTMSDMANTALRDEINIPPTIHVDQGSQIAVFVQRDLDFSSLYESPLREALDELKGRKHSAH